MINVTRSEYDFKLVKTRKASIDNIRLKEDGAI